MELIRAKSEAGLTLIELIVVVALIAVMSVLASHRLDSLFVWKQQGAVRELAETWQFLQQEATNRGERYRLVLDFNDQNYLVRQEILLEPGESQQVDYLKNLRTRREKERRQNEENQDVKSVEEEFEEAEKHEGLPLENLFYEHVYGDADAPLRLGVPLEYPSMGDPHPMTAGVMITALETPRGVTKEGAGYIRILPSGASESAAILLEADGQYFTLVNSPSTGTVRVTNGIDEDALKDAAKLK